ncbi:hypothetical protein BG015_002097 [Linnemannia schmuckeri]|uniref:Uncharacterized protein n=1 Tax=Linnemannia schmuckeri TaxID=64567 RepID=A0A9P5SAU4_9FUNG|nr:hypothetical protein BG015_002097 [Linnemannia schmuckeri]
MSIASISTTSTTLKKTRRFSIVRLFSSSSNNSSNNGSTSPLSTFSSSTTLNDANTPYRHSMDPKSSSPSSMDTMQTEIIRERRKSIAALTHSPRCSMSLDFRPASARRPILGGRKESVPQAEMNEKMREFDELLQTPKTSTIRITLTPSLLQDAY